MKKSLFLMFIFFTMWSCKNEEENLPGENFPPGVTADYVKLSSENSQVAGSFQFDADESEVDVTWISFAACNLDTTQTKVVLKNGRGVLPIRWLEKQSNGEYAPELTAFKAWVMIKGDKYSKSIPLVWSDSVDPDVLSHSIQTRANDVAPRASLIQFGPSDVIMDKVTGGWTYARIQNIESVNLDYSQITTEMNVNLADAPTTFTKSRELTYPWLNGTAPENGFTVLVVASAPIEGFASSFTLKYKDGGGEEDTGGLVFDNSTLPVGNIPATGGTYDFNFVGDTYTGSVQVDAFDVSDNVLVAGSKTTTKKSTIVIPANTAEARTIIFKYKIDGNDNWLSLPNSTIRVQDGQGTTPPTPGDVPSFTGINPPGDIPDRGGVYSTVFYNYVGTVDFRAVSGNGRKLASTSVELTAGGVIQASLTIPEASFLKDNQVIFQYKVADGEWIVMETRKQIVETFASGSIVDMPNTIPVGGGTYHYESSGTLSALLTIVVQDDNGVLAQSRGAVGGRISITVPANTTGKPRAVFFWYKRDDLPGKMSYIQRGDQAGR